MNITTWYEMLILARTLNSDGEKIKAYLIYKNIELDSFKFDKYRYGTYEDYIVDKVRFLIEKAVLETEIASNQDGAIKYLERALELLDGMESVYPYINIKDVKVLKEKMMITSKKS